MTAQAKFTTNTAGNPFLTRLYDIESVDDCRSIYDDWATTYDADLYGPAQDYVAPNLVTQALLAAKGDLSGRILDAGCGSGLSGVSLAEAGAKDIDGIDLSPGMLKIAEPKGVYRSLAVADLSKPIDKPDGEYDAVTCVGTWTHGHVGPIPSLKEFVRVTKKGGVIAGTVLDDAWSAGGYEAEVDRLKSEGLIDVMSAEKAPYRRAAGVSARILVVRKL